jgi:hypothetical protein
VTITDNTGARVGGVDFVDIPLNAPKNTVAITHNAFEINKVYTVSVPVDVVPLYTMFTQEPITWLFSTGTTLGLQTLDQAVSVYPTLSKGSLTVKTPGAATVKVRDLSGRVLATYPSTGNLSIDLPYENGIYLIVVENGKSVSTHKVVLNN